MFTTLKTIDRNDIAVTSRRDKGFSVGMISAGELYGGVEEFIASLCRHLKENTAIRPVVVLLEKGELYERLRNAGVVIHFVPLRHKYDILQASKIAAILREENVSIIHSHGYKGTLLGALAARRLGIPLIKTEHGASEPLHGWDGVKLALNYRIDRVTTSLFVESLVYITRDLLIQKGLTGRQKTLVIHNGIPPVDDLTRDDTLFEPGKFNVGIVGRLTPVKGHDILFKAVRRARTWRDIRVHVIGSGHLLESLEKSVTELNLNGQVKFLGFKRDVGHYMAGLDCLAMPSLNEGLPYTLLEAMHQGLPIVASAVGGMKEVLVPNETALLFKPGDVAALSDQLDRLCGDRQLRLRLGGAARQVARESFSIEKMANEYMLSYRDLIPLERSGLQ